MSYYGGYASYTSYATTSYTTGYDYNNSYDATSCYDTGKYIQNLTHYNHEVRYGSYGNQCSNWQNTASSIMLWHLLVHQNDCAGWHPPEDDIIDITLEVDEEEHALTGFTDGVLAFLEQIGGHVTLGTRQINLTFPETIHDMDVDFIHGMLAFFIEPLGLDAVIHKVNIITTHPAIASVYDDFKNQYDALKIKNQRHVHVIQNAITQTEQLDVTNTETILARKKSSKIGFIISALATAAMGAVTVTQFSQLDTNWQLTLICLTVIAIIFAISYAANMFQSPDKLCRKVLNSMEVNTTILEQLMNLDQAA